jgi:hypothetical protein
MTIPRLPLFSVLCLASALLAQTNPTQKSGYLDVVTPLIQKTCCQEHVVLACDRAQTAFSCRIFRPLAQQMTRQVLNFYTLTPRNHLFFTLYVTQLPQGDIHGIGIAGHYFFWPLSPELSHVCESLI